MDRKPHLNFMGPARWVLGLIFMAPAVCPAQPAGRVWRQANPGNYPPPGGVMLWDSARQRIVRVKDTSLDVIYETGLDGHWIKKTPASYPPIRVSNHPVYDGDRQRILIFGGMAQYYRYYTDTWEWDGENWTQLPTAHTPGARLGAAMAYDSKRKRILLFGGRHTDQFDNDTYYDDTWQFDGTDWTKLAPAHSPGPLFMLSMVYDTDRDRLVLYGGLQESNQLDGETWEWNGTDWLQCSPIQDLPALGGLDSLAYDSAHKRTLLFGGATGDSHTPAYLTDLWAWNGSSWAKLPAAATPEGRSNPQIVYVPDTDRLLLSGGNFSQIPPRQLNDWWAWDGQTWREICLGDNPPYRSTPALGCDEANGQVVLFGGSTTGPTSLQETWVWDGRYWERKWPAHSPSARAGAALAWDGVRNKLLLFGGLNETSSTYYNDTWVWDGLDWTQLHPAQSPPAQYLAAMTWDPARHKILMNNGTAPWAATVPPGTWEWDGAGWTSRTPTLQPAQGGAMVYDGNLQKPLLYFPDYHTIYSWEGANWTLVFKTPWYTNLEYPALAPGGRQGGLLRFGGRDLFGIHNDVWVWDGSGWLLFPFSNPPPRRYRHALVYDSARDACLVFGGTDLNVGFQDTWVLENPNRARLWENYR